MRSGGPSVLSGGGAGRLPGGGAFGGRLRVDREQVAQLVDDVGGAAGAVSAIRLVKSSMDSPGWIRRTVSPLTTCPL